MANPVLLNNVHHKDLRVITTRGAEYGDNIMCALTFPREFRTLQAHYPIVFRKTADGSAIEPVALFGFEDGENLFLGPDGWDCTDIPASVERHPFLIGRNGDELLMHVDMDNPRVSRTEGEACYLEHGGITPFLDRMNSTLFLIHEGLQSLPAYTAALIEHELVESFVLDVELDDGSAGRLSGFYAINEDKLFALDGAVLEKLQKAGFLQAIYMQLASMSQFRDLILRKNRAHAAAR